MRNGCMKMPNFLSIGHNIAVMMRELVIRAGYGSFPMILHVVSSMGMYLVVNQRVTEGVIKGNTSPCKVLPLTM